MQHKLVAFTYSTDNIMTEYVEKQLQAIKNIDPEVEIEHVNENDYRLAKYSKYSDRFPCFMIFKGSACKNFAHTKLSTEELISWYISKRG